MICKQNFPFLSLHRLREWMYRTCPRWLPVWSPALSPSYVTSGLALSWKEERNRRIYDADKRLFKIYCGRNPFHRICHRWLKRGGPAKLSDLFEKNPYMEKIYPDMRSRSALTVFKIYEGIGEWFDLSKFPIERASFSFGVSQKTCCGFAMGRSEKAAYQSRNSILWSMDSGRWSDQSLILGTRILQYQRKELAALLCVSF